MTTRGCFGLVGLMLGIAVSASGAVWAVHTPADQDLARYFRDEALRLAEQGDLTRIRTAAEWEARRSQWRMQLFEMLGLWPLPERTALHPIVTGRVEESEFVVEKLHFQSMPGLYVTANLYLPRGMTRPAPAILYVCGHSLVKTNGVSLGNKTAYQHHGAWFARNGYVCLVLDTLQLGEIEGLHHGTYREGQWWWNSRGYSPAGVEAWNSIRALDYLETRPEVDRQKIGMTGRSGGGSYTWTTAALDERVRVAAPVAGLTDLRNQVIDGCVEGHCDCMFFVNTHRWDFARVAALIAPRPLLIVNSDSDTIFPLDGVERIHAQVRHIYQLLGVPEKLGLVIGPGPHKDTQDLQVPVFRWFNRYLRGSDPVIERAATPVFDPAALRVFDRLPPDQINARIADSFVPGRPKLEASELPAMLRQQSFGGWPDVDSPLQLHRTTVREREAERLEVWEFDSQPHVHLSLVVVRPARNPPAGVTLRILGEMEWAPWLTAVRMEFGESIFDGDAGKQSAPADGKRAEEIRLAVVAARKSGRALAWLAPRGIGPTRWSGDEGALTQIRRRFMLLGQTLDGMRVWDVRRGVQALHAADLLGEAPLEIEADGGMAVDALYAALFEPGVRRLGLRDLPESHRSGPDYLNVLKFTDLQQTLELVRLRIPVAIDRNAP